MYIPFWLDQMLLNGIDYKQSSTLIALLRHIYNGNDKYIQYRMDELLGYFQIGCSFEDVLVYAKGLNG